MGEALEKLDVSEGALSGFSGNRRSVLSNEVRREVKKCKCSVCGAKISDVNSSPVLNLCCFCYGRMEK